MKKAGEYVYRMNFSMWK